jgi:hypothetical protein
MMHWMKLVHLGDLALTLPAAAAATAWLMASRAWRPAFWWSLLFVLGFGLVGVTKIAFMGWGSSLPGLDFKALSGHATGTTAVFPTVFYLMLQSRTAQARAAGVAAGLALGVLMGMLVVILDHHTAAEAIAGCAVGAMISLGFIRLAGDLAPNRPALSLLCFGLVFLVAAWLMKSAPVGYWMIRVALLLSGNERTYAWDAGN